MADRIISGEVVETEPVIVTGTDRLVFDSKKTSHLTCPNLILKDHAQLVMRPKNKSICHTMTIDFDPALNDGFVGGAYTDEVALSDPGIWVRDHARIDAQGAPVTEWCHMTGALLGILTMDTAPSNWKTGDVIVVAPTAEHDYDGFEERTIVSVKGKRVTIDRPLDLEHPAVTSAMVAGWKAYPEVLHITRNVCFDAPEGGGQPHLHCQSDQPQNFQYTCSEQFGHHNDDLLGRYAHHMHMTGDANAGQVWHGLVVTNSGQRGFVPHMSNGITYKRCIVYNCNREGYWWDPATMGMTETNDVVYDGCVGALITGTHAGSSAFELRNGNGNACINCVAVGNTCRGTSSGYAWPTNATSEWDFASNLAHNNKGHGAYIWQNSGNDHVLTDFVTYRNGAAGILEGSYLNHYVTIGGWHVGNDVAGLTQTAVSDNRGDWPLRYEEVIFDAAGASPNAVAFSPPEIPRANKAKDHRVRLNGCHLGGHTKTAIGFVRGAGTPNGPEAIFTDCTVPAMSTLIWFEDWLDPETTIEWVNTATGEHLTLVPQNDPRPGTVRSEWNCKVLA